jgi:3-oxoacyl-[acyl-carrier protein] reductase
MVSRLTADTVVAITGTSRGIGRALARAFARAGVRLVVHARRQEAASEIAGIALADGAAQVLAVAGDIASDEDVGPRMVRVATRAWGRLDVLILNAGVLGPMRPLVDTTPEAFREVMHTNVCAQFDLARAALPTLIRQGSGVLVFMSTGLARFALPHYGAYCASKHALEGLAKTLAEEHRRDGVASLAVAPGMVKTDMLAAALMGEDMAEYDEPERVAQGYVRLVDEALGPRGAALSGEPLDIAPWLPAP